MTTHVWASSPATSPEVTSFQPADIAAVTVDGNEREHESDSGVDDVEDNSSTCSVPEQHYDGVQAHGRTYHYRKGVSGDYPYPMDAAEVDRLDVQHQLTMMTWNNRLYQAPVTDPNRVLDLGTGRGLWAIDVADQIPQAIVTGIDLAPIQPSWVPSNCAFENDDFNRHPWNHSHPFDFVFGRFISSSIADPPAFFQSVYTHLSPGGWVEFQDMTLPTSDDDSIPHDSALVEWSKLWAQQHRARGRDPALITSTPKYLERCGFQHVQVVRRKIPQNTWPADERLKAIGRLHYLNISMGLDGFSKRLFLGGHLMDAAALEVLLARVRSNLSDVTIHTYWPMYSVYGQKPDVTSVNTAPSVRRPPPPAPAPPTSRTPDISRLAPPEPILRKRASSTDLTGATKRVRVTRDSAPSGSSDANEAANGGKGAQHGSE